jgi:hypothetical protein
LEYLTQKYPIIYYCNSLQKKLPWWFSEILLPELRARDMVVENEVPILFPYMLSYLPWCCFSPNGNFLILQSKCGCCCWYPYERSQAILVILLGK